LQKVIQEWVDVAEYDLNNAEICINGGHYLWAMVMCQQTIEKTLKAIHIKNNSSPFRRTHKLLQLAQDINIIHHIDDEKEDLFNDLVTYYLDSRYPDTHKKLKVVCDENYMQITLSKTKEVYQWLKTML
jgi:HEPN domain-containing protein